MLISLSHSLTLCLISGPFVTHIAVISKLPCRSYIGSVTLADAEQVQTVNLFSLFSVCQALCFLVSVKSLKP